MTDQPDTDIPTPEQKAAALAVLSNPEYLGDDTANEATRDDPVTE